MKKVFGFFMALLFMSNMSFSNNFLDSSTNCLTYAMSAMVDEQEHYGFIHDRGEYLEGLTFYYDACVEGGDGILGPIFL